MISHIDSLKILILSVFQQCLFLLVPKNGHQSKPHRGGGGGGRGGLKIFCRHIFALNSVVVKTQNGTQWHFLFQKYIAHA